MNNFDKNIRKKLIDAEMSVSDDLWEAIEARIIHQKDNSRYWFFFLLPFLFLPVLMVYQYEGNSSFDKLPILIEMDKLGTNELSPIASIEGQKMVFGFIHSSIKASSNNIDHTDDVALYTDIISDLNSSASNSEIPYSSSLIQRHNILGQAPVLSSHTEISSLNLNNLSSVEQLREVRAPTLFGNNTGSECPTFDIYHPGFYLFAQHSSDIPFQSMSAKNAEFVDYLQKRRGLESAAYSFATTFGIGYMFDNGIIAESGLSYDRINMKFHYLDENAIRNSTVITIDTMILNDIDTIIQTDTMIVQQTGLNEVITYNSFTQIDIPLVLGYEIPLSERFRLSIKGGILINIRSSNKGHMLGLNDFPIAYGSNSSSDNAYYKTNIGFSYTGGLNLEADLNDSFSLYAGANFKYYPNNFSLPENQINEKYTKLGFMTGIKYRL